MIQFNEALHLTLVAVDKLLANFYYLLFQMRILKYAREKEIHTKNVYQFQIG